MGYEVYTKRAAAGAGAPGIDDLVAPREETANSITWTVDSEGIVRNASGAWHTMLGWRPEDVSDSHVSRLLHPADFAAVESELEAVAQVARALPDLRSRFRMRSGDYRTLTWMAVGSIDAGTLAVAWDAGEEPTSHRAIEWLGRRYLQLQRQVKALEHEAATRESLIAAVAHELSEPLVVAESCMISVENALAETIDDDIRERLAVVGRVSARGRVLIETLLADARSADQGVATRKVDSGTIVCEVLELFGPRIQARSADVQIEPLPTLEADAVLLAVVFQNLISNALNYGPRERGRISIAADREDDMWRFRVTSGGNPLPVEDIERIFRPFQRVPGERRARGAGLGLSICRRIIERHGGRIGATPEPGIGNTFWFTLPA